MAIKACVFDFDGTLGDSMWVWDALGDVFTEARGLKKFDGFSELLAVYGLKEGPKELLRRYELDEDPQQVLAEWLAFAAQKYATEVPFKPCAKEYLAQLRESGIKTAVATAQRRKPLEAAIENNNAAGLFDLVLVCDEVTDTGKTTPAVYLAAAQMLGVQPQECVVFEDVSKAAVQAHRGGMRVVGVSDDHAQQNRAELIEEADLFIEGFEELLNKDLEALLG